MENETFLEQKMKCLAGEHVAWEQPVNYTIGRMEKVWPELRTDGHGTLHCEVCKFCRCLYVRSKNE